MKFFLIAITFLLSVQAFAVDRWGAFSDPFPINDAVAYGDDGVMLATGGGIRYRTRVGDVVYHSEHGLETSNFYSVVASEQGLFAVSEYGMIANLQSANSSWRVLNRSYVKNNVRALPGVAELGGNVLVIAFEDRLAFFDLQKSVSLLTVDRIGSRFLSISPVEKMVVRGDSLYVKVSGATFVRQMNWEKLSKDVRLNDPTSWTALPADVQVPGLESNVPAVEVDGTVLTDPFLYSEGTSRVRWKIKSAGGYFLAGTDFIAFWPQKAKTVEDLSAYSFFTLGDSYEVHALPIGGVITASIDGKLSYGNLSGFPSANYVFDGLGPYTTAYSSKLKLLAHLPDGHLFYHVWGLVYQIYSGWGSQLEYSFVPTDGQCFDHFIENYPISAMAVAAPDQSGFLTTTASNDGYSVVYLTKNGEVYCAKQVGEKKMPQAIYAKVGNDNKWWVYVSSRNGLVVTDEGDLDLIKFPPPRTNGGMLADGELKTIRGGTTTPIDLAYDTTTNRLWFVTTSSLGYLDEDRDTLIMPTSMKGLLGAEYTSLDVDVHGNLWAGTSNQGVYRLTRKGLSPDTLSVQHFSSKEGLLSNNVHDVAIDPVLGVAWFAHDKGISFYQRNDLKDASLNMTDSAKVGVRAYPVPFRPLVHARFTIDGIAENSVVSIYNRGGALIRAFRNEEILGGKVEWDGCDKSNKLVAPGVYYYVVNSGSKVKKGKFIIIH